MNWLGFVLGKLLHWWAKSDANASTSTHMEWLKRNRRSLPVRAALSAAIFYFWAHNPEMMTKVVQWAARFLSAEGSTGMFKEAMLTVNVPLNVVTAGVFGYVIDSVLDKLCCKFPFLREYIPAVNGKADGAHA